MQEGLPEGATQLDLVVLPLETLRTLHEQIVEEFNDREQLLKAKKEKEQEKELAKYKDKGKVTLSEK